MGDRLRTPRTVELIYFEQTKTSLFYFVFLFRTMPPHLNMGRLDELEKMETFDATIKLMPWCEVLLSIVGIMIIILLGYYVVKIIRKLKCFKNSTRDRSTNIDMYQIEIPRIEITRLREQSTDYEQMASAKQLYTSINPRVNRMPEVTFSSLLDSLNKLIENENSRRHNPAVLSTFEQPTLAPIQK